jgi:O-antigen/teichoic acid export membrane protein
MSTPKPKRIFLTFCDSGMYRTAYRIRLQAEQMGIYDRVITADENKLDKEFVSKFRNKLKKGSISIFFGLNALGIYSFVFTVYASLYGLLSNSFKVFLPKLSKLHGNQQYNDLKKYFKKISIYSFLMSTILASIVLLVWKTFISIYLTNEFANQSFPYIQVFALLLIVRSLEPVFYYFFNAIAKPSVLVVNLFIGAILTISGYLLFIPVLDIFGIVIAQIVSNICVYLYNFYMIKKRGFNEYTK